MRTIRPLLWTCLLVSIPALVTSASAAESSRPNVIFILCDDLGWGDLGVLYQNESAHDRKQRTPNLDRMAGEGMQLRAHYCPAPVCAPSRASLLTGVHQGHASVRDNQFDKMLIDNHTLASVMREAGYRTALIGKYGLQGKGSDPASWPAYPTKRGFDEFYGYVRHVDGHVHYPADHWPLGNSKNHQTPKEVWHNDQEVSAGLTTCYTTDLFTARAKFWVAEQVKSSGEQPFFLYLAYDTPHAALQVPSVAYPQGQGLDGGVQWLGEPNRMINTAFGEIDSYRHPEYVGRDWTDVEERFATMVRRVDDGVGDLLQTLRDLGIDENTLVVLSSDNGPHHESYLAGEEYAPTSFQSYGPFDGTKRDTWEGGIRVPTLAWWPGVISAGAISDRPSQFHDWMPTLAAAAGLAPPARSDGVSLLPTLTGSGAQADGQVYVEYSVGGSTRPYDDFAPRRRGQKRGQMQVIFLDGYKGVRVDIKAHDDPFAIYDLAADTHERNNLAGSSPRFEELQQRMQRRVLQLRMPNATAPRPYDDEPVPADVEEPKLPGLRRDYFSGKFAYVPGLAGRSPEASFVVASPADRPADTKGAGGRSGAVVDRGWIRVPKTADYTFELASPGGAFLRIHDAAVVDADFGATPNEPARGTIRLAEGLHPVRLTRRRDPESGATTASQIRLSWSVGTADPAPIPDSVWSCE